MIHLYIFLASAELTLFIIGTIIAICLERPDSLFYPFRLKILLQCHKEHFCAIFSCLSSTKMKKKKEKVNYQNHSSDTIRAFFPTLGSLGWHQVTVPHTQVWYSMATSCGPPLLCPSSISSSHYRQEDWKHLSWLSSMLLPSPPIWACILLSHVNNTKI